MSTSNRDDDGGQEWHETKGREPEWVRDMCNLPWVVMVRKDGSIEIVSDDNRNNFNA